MTAFTVTGCLRPNARRRDQKSCFSSVWPRLSQVGEQAKGNSCSRFLRQLLSLFQFRARAPKHFQWEARPNTVKTR